MLGFLIGIISGIVANQVYDYIKRIQKWKKPRFICRLCGTKTDELIEKELRTKTSNSEYGIELYNLSANTLLLDYFEIYHKKKLVVGTCVISEDAQRIDPNQRLTYTLTEQDADALCWHCENDHFDRCNVLFHTVEGKIIKVSLDVSSILLQIEISKHVDSAIEDA